MSKIYILSFLLFKTFVFLIGCRNSFRKINNLFLSILLLIQTDFEAFLGTRIQKEFSKQFYVLIYISKKNFILSRIMLLS